MLNFTQIKEEMKENSFRWNPLINHIYYETPVKLLKSLKSLRFLPLKQPQNQNLLVKLKSLQLLENIQVSLALKHQQNPNLLVNLMNMILRMYRIFRIFSKSLTGLLRFRLWDFQRKQRNLSLIKHLNLSANDNDFSTLVNFWSQSFRRCNEGLLVAKWFDYWCKGWNWKNYNSEKTC